MNDKEKGFKEFFEEFKENDQNKNTSEYHLTRILNTKFINPFEVLQLSPEATDDEIKKQYRTLSLLLHPDKCMNEKASDAFHILESSYKTVLDPDKKNYYQRILREAKERVDIQRKKENKARAQKGLSLLPLDNMDNDIRTMMKQIIEEIEEKKDYGDNLKFAYKKRERDEEEEKKDKEEKDNEFKKKWENFRDKRVRNWNKFQSKITNGKTRGKYETRPPKYKIEERIDEQTMTVFRPNTII